MVGERLAELRTKKNMTQEEFADYMGVTRQSVSKWELGKAFPDVEKLIRISELYDVSIDYILKGVLPEEKEATGADMMEAEPPVAMKKTGIVVSVCITSVLALVAIVFMAFCILQHNWLGRDREIPVRVDKVYEQLSFVEVSFIDENGEPVSEKVFIDVEGIRPGDYIYTYVDGDNIYVDYGVATFAVTGIIIVLLLIMLGLQIKELDKYE